MILEKLKSLFGRGKTKSSAGKYTGVVKRVYNKKGYGFIESPDFDKQIFVHFTDTLSKIRVGKEVNFGIKETEKGPRAINVEVIN